MIIYKVTNSINNKIYIGQTTQTIEKRWRGHLNDCKVQRNNKFYNAIKKHGPENFKIEPIEEEIISQDELSEREKYWINFYDSYAKGYNSTFGGEASPMRFEEIRLKVSEARKGKKLKEETKQKIRISHLGKKGTPHTEEHKKYISEFMKNRPTSEETREKLRKANLGKKQSKETALKRSISMKGKKFTAEHKKKISESLKGNCNVKVGADHHRSKQVNQINIVTGELIRTFESASLAQTQFSGNKRGGAIIRVANGKGKTAYGYKWEWDKQVQWS